MKRYTKEEKKRINRIILITFLVLCGGLSFALICKKGFYIPWIFNKIKGNNLFFYDAFFFFKFDDYSTIIYQCMQND